MAEGTAMKTDPALLGLVPVGEENAVTARLLWQVNRVGVVATVKCKLNMMASEGIVRKEENLARSVGSDALLEALGIMPGAGLLLGTKKMKGDWSYQNCLCRWVATGKLILSVVIIVR
jgi:hypothetical protein